MWINTNIHSSLIVSCVNYDKAKNQVFPHLNIPSYMLNITAAFGMTLIRCAVRPPYNLLTPSSAMTILNVCIKPVYFILPFTSG